MKIKLIALLLCLVFLLVGCGNKDNGGTQENQGNPDSSEAGTQGEVADLGDDSKTFGESLDDLGAYDGYFKGESTDIVVVSKEGRP